MTKSKAELMIENTVLRNRFALLKEHSAQTLIVLGGMRQALGMLRTENALLREKVREMDYAAQVAPPPELKFVENENDKGGRIVPSDWAASGIALGMSPEEAAKVAEPECAPGACDWALDNEGGSRCVNCGAFVPF
jgi:hypothetical protein